ncbi:MAG: hypothetical protein ABEJ05_10590 [Haloglomus sp.]
MAPDDGPTRGGGERGSTGTEANEVDPDVRAMVDWYFGDLVDTVAADRSITTDQLLSALTRIEQGARSRREQLEGRGQTLSTAGAPGEVLVLSTEAFTALARAHGLTDRESDAVRTVHRRMARAIAEPPDSDDVAPLVYAAAPADLH